LDIRDQPCSRLRGGLKELSCSFSGLLAVAAAGCIASSGLLVTDLQGRVDGVRPARWTMAEAGIMTGAVSLAIGGWRTPSPRLFGLRASSSLFGIITATTTDSATIHAIGRATRRSSSR
jgi:hypothetical protein